GFTSHIAGLALLLLLLESMFVMATVTGFAFTACCRGILCRTRLAWCILCRTVLAWFAWFTRLARSNLSRTGFTRSILSRTGFTRSIFGRALVAGFVKSRPFLVIGAAVFRSACGLWLICGCFFFRGRCFVRIFFSCFGGFAFSFWRFPCLAGAPGCGVGLSFINAHIIGRNRNFIGQLAVGCAIGIRLLLAFQGLMIEDRIHQFLLVQLLITINGKRFSNFPKLLNEHVVQLQNIVHRRIRYKSDTKKDSIRYSKTLGSRSLLSTTLL